jgi:hypothetical protein
LSWSTTLSDRRLVVRTLPQRAATPIGSSASSDRVTSPAARSSCDAHAPLTPRCASTIVARVLSAAASSRPDAPLTHAPRPARRAQRLTLRMKVVPEARKS